MATAYGADSAAISFSAFDSDLELGLKHTYMCRDLDRYRAYVIKLTLPA